MFQIRSCINIFTKFYKLPVPCYVSKISKHRTIATSVLRQGKFYSNENAFAHGILRSNDKCHVLRGEQNVENVEKYVDIDFNQNWSNLSTDDIIEHLRMVGNYCNNNGLVLSDQRFDKFVDSCAERCFVFTDDQLIESLKILIHYPKNESPKSRNFVELWSCLDEACVDRINKWTFDKILYVCDHWYMLDLGKLNAYNLRRSLKIGRKLRELAPHQMVQLMFYVNVKRSAIVEMVDFEINFLKSFDQLSLNEISVMCMGFFKTETRINTPELIGNIFKRLIREIGTVENIPFTCILKALRCSSNPIHIDYIKQLLDDADDQIPRLSLLSCLHLALPGTTLQIYHQNCQEQIIHRFAGDVKSLRMKYIERITFVIGLFNFKSESRIEKQFCQKILDELRDRVNDIVAWPRCYTLTSLHYLTMKGYCDEELMSVAVSRKFLDFAYGNQCHYGKEIFWFYSYVKINFKGRYNGNELTEKNRQYMGKMKTEYIPDRSGKFSLTTHDKLLLEVKETLEELCDHCYFAHALPHFDWPDVIIAYDKSTNTGIDVAHYFPEIYTGKIIDRSMLIEGLDMNPSDVEIINIIVVGRNHYTRDTNKLGGTLTLKVEQSKMLGFCTVLIPW